MATFKDSAYRAADSLLTTELNSLGIAGFTALGPELDNTTHRDMMATFDLYLASINTTGISSPGVVIHAVQADEAGTYTAITPSGIKGASVLTIPVSIGTSVKQVSGYGTMYLAPGKYKFFLENSCGVALAASGNTLKMRRYTPESA